MHTEYHVCRTKKKNPTNAYRKKLLENSKKVQQQRFGLCCTSCPPRPPPPAASWAKVEAALHKAEDKLEALIGPFRLRETVRTAMTRGMLMPFPVSVQRGKGSAKLERDQPMREVRTHPTVGVNHLLRIF